jgi:hypothetical protein
VSGTLTTWQLLLSPAHAVLVAEAGAIDAADVAAIERVRTRHSASRELMHAALQLAIARRKLADKWPGRSGTLIADPPGAEMASSEAASRHKAARFAESLAPGAAVVDLCSGIGGDAIALREAGLAVTVVDNDPVRAWMAGQNARCPSLAADAAAEDLPPGPFHLDPARRTDDGSRRLWQIDDHQPGPSIWRRIIERRRSGAIKLGPGLDIAAACRVLPPGTAHEVEIISENGRLTQGVMWIGELARGCAGSRVATLLTDAGATSLRADYVAPDAPMEPPCGPLRRHLIETDPSIERAGLLALACRKDGRMTGIHPGLGLLTSDAPPHGPMYTSFEVLAHMPWIEKNVRAWLRAHGGGVVEVKTRGRAVDPDVLQKHLRGEGPTTYTLFVLRLGRTVEAFATRRGQAGSS